MLDGTQIFKLNNEVVDQNKIILRSVYDALNEKGYNSINQIVGYLLSEDPTYITNYKDARANIRKLDRDELLRELVRSYLAK
ncbi:MAG: IreB family regulatory phosphoprotein [Clostridia bacterium]|nr:IreB family regulatory phosphoprotein [Clostridia bacterium]MBR4955343.1 IreB family regulatory phosphoprotein [Clostridia bacterium]MBR5903810.1 IreB family regulatory phosphoprotein [Clostridia bacterium]